MHASIYGNYRGDVFGPRQLLMEVASPANRWEIPSWVPPRVQYFISLIHFTASPGRSRAPAPQTKNRPSHLVGFFKGFEPPNAQFRRDLVRGGGRGG